MYMYDSFETAGAFTLLRPIFVTFIIAAILMFFIIILLKLRRKVANSLSVIGLSVVSMIVSVQLLFYDTIIVDEIGSEGDEVTTYMFLVILIFGFLNPIIYYMKRNKKEILKG